MPWKWKTDSAGKKVRVWVAEEQEPVHFMADFRRRIGFEVPDPVSQYTPYLELVAEGQRPKRPPAVHHTAKINGRRRSEAVPTAAAAIDTAGEDFSSLQLSRKLPGGRTLLETIALGGDGHDAAQSLVSMLQRETEQRRDRAIRIAGRKPLAESEFSPGMAALRESSG